MSRVSLEPSAEFRPTYVCEETPRSQETAAQKEDAEQFLAFTWGGE